MPLFKQGLIKINRPAPDTVILNFKKEVSEMTNVSALNFDIENWYDIIPQKNIEKLVLKIKNREIAAEDTLMLTVRTNDFDNTLGDKIDFEYSKPAVYKRKLQKILSSARPEPNLIWLTVNIPPEKDFNIRLANNPKKKDWFEKTVNPSKDTVFFNITNPIISINDTLTILADYFVKLNKNVLSEKTDTLKLIYKKYKRRRREKKDDDALNIVTETGEKLSKVSIEIPTKYDIMNDSVSERILYIDHPWKTGHDYILKADSGALRDIYQNKSVKKETKFNVRKKDYYGSVYVNISDIKWISHKNFYNTTDTAAVDSIEYSVLPEGQVLVYLTDSEKKLKGFEIITQNDTLKFENLDPGNYQLKIVYDKNKNKKWDTGDYLKNIQPERILIYPSEVTIKSNWLNEVDWKISPPEN
jgi:hypothetical protein